MTVLYADTSALLRAYLTDEPGHAEVRPVLLDGRDPVVTSELARVEFAGAIGAARRAARIPQTQELLDLFDLDCRVDGPITLLAMNPDAILPSAYRLVLDHRLRTLDAIHLAVALQHRGRLAEIGDFAFVTKDADQATAARSLGLEVR